MVVFSSTSFNPIYIIKLAQFVNGLFLPITGISLLWAVNQTHYLGSYINAKYYNVIGLLIIILSILISLRSLSLLWSKYIDLNCDMGESYYDKIVGNDSKIMPYITSCNIACGFHGGDPLTIRKTIKLAIDNKVKIGAHPSYFDLEGFGRRKIHLNLKELESIILYQVSAIKGITEYYGEKLHHVKPHGALYNMASIDDNIAEVIVLTIKKINPKLKLYGPSKMKWKKISQKHGIKYVSEVFQIEITMII